MTFGQIVVCVFLIGGVATWLTLEIINTVKLIRSRRQPSEDNNKKEVKK